MLPKENRLTRKSDFESVRQNGQFISSRNLSLSRLDRQDGEPSRFGIIVSKKISMRAHVRNRIKRILRVIIRSNLTEIKPGQDFVIIVKPSIIHASHATIELQAKKILV